MGLSLPRGQKIRQYPSAVSVTCLLAHIHPVVVNQCLRCVLSCPEDPSNTELIGYSTQDSDFQHPGLGISYKLLVLMIRVVVKVYCCRHTRDGYFQFLSPQNWPSALRVSRASVAHTNLFESSWG